MGWKNKKGFENIVDEMVDWDMRKIMREVGRNDL